jgi:serine O-acetyltransferase
VVPRLIYVANRLLFAVVLPPSVVIGRNVVLGYAGLGTVIHARAVIGDHVVIGPNVTIGGRAPHVAVPVIGEGVSIGAGARIIGPLKIGRGAVVGANAVVVQDVLPDCVVGGVPARVLRSTKCDSGSDA